MTGVPMGRRFLFAQSFGPRFTLSAVNCRLRLGRSHKWFGLARSPKRTDMQFIRAVEPWSDLKELNALAGNAKPRIQLRV